jgi:hypothetical protein
MEAAGDGLIIKVPEYLLKHQARDLLFNLAENGG